MERETARNKIMNLVRIIIIVVLLLQVVSLECEGLSETVDN